MLYLKRTVFSEGFGNKKIVHGTYSGRSGRNAMAHVTLITEGMSSKPSTSDTAKSFNKILALPRSSSRARSAADLKEAVKKLRRLILVDGIPSTKVGSVSCSTKCSSHIMRIGLHPPTQDMEDTLGCDGTAGEHLFGICLQGTL